MVPASPVEEIGGALRVGGDDENGAPVVPELVKGLPRGWCELRPYSATRIVG